MNSAKLRGALAERGVRQSDVAQAINISQQSFSRKLNGKTDFLVSEANAIAEFLSLSEDEKVNIFLR